jgi:hypothetical protein
MTVARDASRVIREHDLCAAVIGGVAVVLHGHVRTTLDVDIYTADAEALAAALRDAGFVWDIEHKQFMSNDVPLQLVTEALVPSPPRAFEDVQGIRTVSLADLLNIKLRSGAASILRAQDMADVIALMRTHRLTGAFAPRIDKALRPDFRKLLDAMEHG